MTFLQIKDTENFFTMIDNCTGRVLLKSSEGHAVDMRRNLLIKELLTMSCRDRCIERLELTIENPGDMKNILNYLVLGA